MTSIRNFLSKQLSRFDHTECFDIPLGRIEFYTEGKFQYYSKQILTTNLLTRKRSWQYSNRRAFLDKDAIYWRDTITQEIVNL